VATKELVLRILEGQTEGYLIEPHASAFAAAGLEPAEVAAVLAELAKDGHALEEEVVAQVPQPALDDDGNEIPGEVARHPQTGEPLLADATDGDGNPVLLDTGWSLTKEGRKVAKENAKKQAPAEEPAAREPGELHPQARDLAASLARNPGATVQELAAEHELPEGEVAQILDSHVVEDGEVRAAGPGQGGGWTQ
jgi:hypothetical protein